MNIDLSQTDKRIMKTLKESKVLLSTYEIAKRANLTWATTNSHCYKLKSLGLIDSKPEKSKHGLMGKIMWWVK